MTAGVPTDLEQFCASEYRRVLGTLALFTGSVDVASELAQEAFLRLCRDWDKVRTYAAPGAWVHRVAVNLALSQRRRRAAEARATARAGAVAGVEPAAELQVEVRDALARLADPERIVIALRYFADLPVDETAEVLGIPVGTVKSRTRRALVELRELGLIETVDAND